YHEVLRGPAGGPYGPRRLARETGLLPLCADMSGFSGVDSTTSEIKSGLYDDLPVVTVETDERTINSALFQASKRYKELVPLIPPRPFDAIDCSLCDGTGIPRDLPDNLRGRIVCYCGGLG